MSKDQYLRTHHCCELSAKQMDQEVSLAGWVGKRRDHGGVIFVDLRDRNGITQVVFDPAIDGGAAAHKLAEGIRNEFVIWCKGKVRSRPEGMRNEKLTTGEIEVACTELRILSQAETPPFAIEDETDVSETVRLKYRYLDLRRPSLQKNILTRAKALSVARSFLDENGFTDIETPILYKSTPEGARDFVVPSRLNVGEFYALPQSPQTLKQLLMISGFDRYYQVARCFRDEDLRADRQPEFSQIDIETSFLDQDQILAIMEKMMARIWKGVLGQDVESTFPRMTYKEAMERFGSDKPDIRFGLELLDLTSVFSKSEFKVFSGALVKDSRGKTGSIRGIVVKGLAEKFSRKDLDDLTKEAGKYGAKGLLWIKVQDGGKYQSPAAKFFSEKETEELRSAAGLQPGDLILMVADAKNKVVFDALGAVRLDLGKRLGQIPKPGEGKPAFLWVTDFPLLEFDDREKRYFALHHPFTRPAEGQEEDFVAGKNLDTVNAAAYDMVLNGVEIGGGSLRIYRPETQSAMFRALGMSEEEAQQKFGFFMEALKYGTPPHGGIALGVERIVGLLCGTNAIRDVMAFPKTQKDSA